MTRNPDQDDHLPIDDGLVRECGDVLAEAHRASLQALHQVAALIGPEAVQSEPPSQQQDFTA